MMLMKKTLIGVAGFALFAAACSEPVDTGEAGKSEASRQPNILLVTERNFRRLGRGELDKLNLEIDKVLRGVRGEQPALEDLQAVQQRNRRIQRLNTCRMMLRTYRQRHRT